VIQRYLLLCRSDDGLFHCSVPACSFQNAHRDEVESHVKRVHVRLRKYVCRVDGCPIAFYECAKRKRHRNSAYWHPKPPDEPLPFVIATRRVWAHNKALDDALCDVATLGESRPLPRRRRRRRVLLSLNRSPTTRCPYMTRTTRPSYSRK